MDVVMIKKPTQKTRITNPGTTDLKTEEIQTC